MWLRPANGKDIRALERLESICFPDAWNENQIRDMLRNDYDEVYVVEDNRKLVAYANLRHVGDDRPECEVMRICAEPDYRRKKYADKLMERMLQFARTRKAASVLLEVRASNDPAMALYRKHGFSEISRRRDYYSNPTEDAVIMQLVL